MQQAQGAGSVLNMLSTHCFLNGNEAKSLVQANAWPSVHNREWSYITTTYSVKLVFSRLHDSLFPLSCFLVPAKLCWHDFEYNIVSQESSIVWKGLY